MKLLYKLTDNEFPYVGVDHVRDISRGVIYNDKNQIALIHLFGDDICNDAGCGYRLAGKRR